MWKLLRIAAGFKFRRLATRSCRDKSFKTRTFSRSLFLIHPAFSELLLSYWVSPSSLWLGSIEILWQRFISSAAFLACSNTHLLLSSCEVPALHFSEVNPEAFWQRTFFVVVDHVPNFGLTFVELIKPFALFEKVRSSIITLLNFDDFTGTKINLRFEILITPEEITVLFHCENWILFWY